MLGVAVVAPQANPAAVKLFGVEEVPTVRVSHLGEADTSGFFDHLRAVRSPRQSDREPKPMQKSL
jgi:hypothetical protein